MLFGVEELASVEAQAPHRRRVRYISGPAVWRLLQLAPQLAGVGRGVQAVADLPRLAAVHQPHEVWVCVCAAHDVLQPNLEPPQRRPELGVGPAAGFPPQLEAPLTTA